MKLLVKTTSSNVWWGIHGLQEKVGWEDLNIFYDNGGFLGRVCLNTKAYLRAQLDVLIYDPEETEYIKAIEQYLEDNQIHYWYYYSKREDIDFCEVPYPSAPKNTEGVKPRSIDIWHPDEKISIATMKDAVRAFGKKFLPQEISHVKIERSENLEDLVQSFKEDEKTLGGGNAVKILFNEKLIDELSKYWKISNT